MTDLYSVLGVEPEATADELRSAYRARARALHPDVNASGDAAAQMAAVNAAYEVLADPARRQEYDRARSGVSLTDLLGRIFGGGALFDDEDMFFAGQQRSRFVHEKRVIRPLRDFIHGVTVRDGGTSVTLPPLSPAGTRVEQGGVVYRFAMGLPEGVQQVGGMHLRMTVDADIYDVLLGSRLTIEAPDGDPLQVTFGPGEQATVVPQRGLPDGHGSRGGLLVQRVAQVLPLELSARERQVLEGLARKSRAAAASERGGRN